MKKTEDARNQREFLVPVHYRSYRIYPVKASSLEVAIQNALTEFPNDPSFVNGTASVDPEEARILNEEF